MKKDAGVNRQGPKTSGMSESRAEHGRQGAARTGKLRLRFGLRPVVQDTWARKWRRQVKMNKAVVYDFFLLLRVQFAHIFILYSAYGIPTVPNAPPGRAGPLFTVGRSRSRRRRFPSAATLWAGALLERHPTPPPPFPNGPSPRTSPFLAYPFPLLDLVFLL